MSFQTLGGEAGTGHSGPMSGIIETAAVRTEIQVDGETASYLTVQQDGPAVLLLHGTYWSRVWLPVLDRLAQAGLRPIAVDIPGLGRSGGELTLATGTVPALADWVARFASVLKLSGPIAVADHDIGGAIAQHLLVHDRLEVSWPALVNSVTYDSWPVSTVARFRDPEIVAATTADEVLAARRQTVTPALAGAATEQRIADYQDPWTDARVRHSWMAMVGGRGRQPLHPRSRFRATAERDTRAADLGRGRRLPEGGVRRAVRLGHAAHHTHTHPGCRAHPHEERARPDRACTQWLLHGVGTETLSRTGTDHE
jgi:pimeloyl-ACP methyl ester carboxylesterase